uniref:Uncharacterized protein n=1 Tax=Anguilla anguilla TaxID=7936 RepID=A0A0E9SIY8_ANGAN
MVLRLSVVWVKSLFNKDLNAYPRSESHFAGTSLVFLFSLLQTKFHFNISNSEKNRQI